MPLARRLGTAACLWLLGLASGAAWAVEVNSIVLRVNNRILTRYDYELRKAERVEAVERANLPPERRQELLASAGEETLRTLYEEMLLLSEADKMGVEVGPAQIRDAIERAKANFGITTEEEFEQALAQSGMTRDQLAQQMERNLLMQQVIGQGVRSRIELDDEDVRRYYQTHPEEFQLPVRLQVREVVVLETSGLPEDERMRLAEQLAQSIGAGEEVDEQLAEASDQGWTTPWINLGWVQPGDLDAALEEAIRDLDGGESSPPVPGRGGLHVLQVMERKESEQLPFAEVEEQIRMREADRLFGEALQEYIRELETQSYIVSNPPPEAANFRVIQDRAPIDPLERFGAVSPAPETGESPPGD